MYLLFVAYAESYLLALCERDRDEELVKLLSVIDVTKVSSQDYLSNIFESLGKRELKNFAEKFILALKASGMFIILSWYWIIDLLCVHFSS